MTAFLIRARRRALALSFGILAVLPLSVQAGVFSSLSEALGDTIHFYRTPDSSETAQSVPLLRAATHPDPNPAKGGGDIIIAGGALVAEGRNMDERAGAVVGSGEISIYTVRPDDDLSRIAAMFSVSTETILWANEIKDPDIIRPGDTLVILPITGIRHTVKASDTLVSIAKKYGAEDSDETEAMVADIVAYNRLASAAAISVGDTIVIPGGMMEAAMPQAPRPAGSPGGAVASGGGGSAGYRHPLPGSVKTQGLHGYNGIDFGGVPTGSSVVAAAGGNVIVAKSGGWNGGYGSYVVVKHAGGTQTLYAHLSSVEVVPGERVSAGERLGGVGSTGRSTGTHLHFEVRGASNPF